jgi:hypothetical protein
MHHGVDVLGQEVVLIIVQPHILQPSIAHQNIQALVESLLNVLRQQPVPLQGLDKTVSARLRGQHASASHLLNPHQAVDVGAGGPQKFAEEKRAQEA